MAPLNNQQNIEYFLQNGLIDDHQQATILYGKEIIQPRQPLPPVPDAIKQYIKEKFSVINNAN